MRPVRFLRSSPQARGISPGERRDTPASRLAARRPALEGKARVLLHGQTVWPVSTGVTGNLRGLAPGLVLVLLLALAPGAAAQTARVSLGGTVTDPLGAVVAGAIVTARNLQTDEVRSVVADSGGLYAFVGLPAGTYSVQALFPGFRNVPTTAIVSNDPLTLDLVLVIAPFVETVTVTRAAQELAVVPQAVGLVVQKQLQPGQRKVSLAEGLRGQPGVFAQDRGNFSESNGLRLSIRAPVRGVGIGIRGLQVLQDDIPLTMPDGTTQASNIDLGSTDRIEVIRGPSAVLYGNAAGGAVTVRTETPSTRRLVVEPDLQVGSDGYRRQQLKTSGTAGGVGYLVNVTRMTTDGFRRHSRAEVRQANVTIRTGLSARTELRGIFNVADMPFGESPSTLTLDDARTNPRSVRQLVFDQGLGEASTQGQGGVTIEHHRDDGSVLRTTGWGVWRDVWNPIPFRIIDLWRTGGGVRVEYSGSASTGAGPLTWTTGIDAGHQRDDRAEHENEGIGAAGAALEGRLLVDQLERVTSVSPFAQMNLAPKPRWMITAGLRADYYRFSAADHLLVDGDQSGSRSLHAVSPTVGVTYFVRPGLHLYGNIATAYETPTLQELSNRPSGEGGFNPDLAPETLRSLEGGVRGFVERWRLTWDVAAYVSRLDNALVQFQRADEQEFYRNAGESSRDGVETLVEWKPGARLTVRATYTYQRFRFVRFATDAADFAGKREPGAPPHQAFASVTYQAAFGLTSTFGIRWVDAYSVNNANSVANWASHVADLRFALDRTWTRLQARPFFGIDNLFDERYNASTVPNALGNRFFEPAPGRQVYVGLALTAGSK